MNTYKKILLYPVIVLLVSILPAILLQRNLHAIRQLSKATTELSDCQTELFFQLNYVEELVLARQRNMQTTEKEAENLLKVGNEKIQRYFLRLENLDIPTNPACREALISINDSYNNFHANIEKILDGKQIFQRRDESRTQAKQIAYEIRSLLAHHRNSRERHLLHAGYTFLLFLLLVLAAFALATLSFWRKLLRPLRLLSKKIRHPDHEENQGDLAIENDELNELSACVNQFFEQSRSANQTKDRFLATMSHEIRTPMNGVIGFLDNLRDTPLNEQQQQYVRLIESSARSLLKVINEILDYSKLSSGKMELEAVAFDLREFLMDRAAMCQRLVNGHRVKVVLDIPDDELIVRADPTRLRQVLDNLLGNAAKFTHKGEIRLELKVRPETDGKIELIFTVADTGIGITAEQRKHLFSAFVQGSATTARKFGGTGLGLNISFGLVKLLGGEIQVDSKVGEGSRFSFSFLAETAQPEECIQPSDHYTITLPPNALRGFWALLVDDTPTNLFLMETVCQSIGLPYRTATNGAEAVDLCTQQKFDLVFMDIQMPVMDGYTAIREIRKLEDSEAIQIVALTASTLQEDINQALQSGATAFVAKPFERNQLLLCIAEYLGIAAERTLRAPLEVNEGHVDLTVRHMYDFMRERYDLSLGEIKMILLQTVADWRPMLENLRAFSRQGDWERVHPIMHRLKGQLSSIGLLDFSEAAGEAGQAIHNGQTEELGIFIDDFADRLAEIFRSLEVEISQNPKS